MISRRPFLAASLIVLLALTAPVHADAAAASRSVPQGFVGTTWGATLVAPDFDIGAETRLMVRSGVESVRIPFYWSVAQPYASAADVPAQDAGRFVDAGGVPTDFGPTDRLVGLAAARRLAILPVVLQSPRWAANDPKVLWSPPRDPADYARFAAALVRRYGPGGSFWAQRPDLRAMPIGSWQIWNEPGQHFFWEPAPSPPDYVALLRAARGAIRGADPRAKIVLAGLNERAWKAIARIYAAGGRGLFDVAAVHPFTLQVNDVMRIIGLVRRTMTRKGDGRVPILVTELSWPTAPRRIYGFEVSEEAQARRARDAIARLAADRRRYGIAGFDWETWLSADSNPDYSFDWAGLRGMSASGPRSKPALATFTRAARRIEGCVKTSVADRCAGG